jgi:hypothetical protein
MLSIENEGASIVILGSFNPSIFQPRWLASLDLIRPEEAEIATIAIIREEVADFTTKWFRLQVLQNRFLLQLLDATHFGPIRDLAAGIFRLLPHTPATRLGLARWFHFPMDSVEAWHDVGHRLAPKQWWNPYMEVAGLRSMTIQGKRPNSEGTLFVKIEPSIIIQPGVFIEVTEEFSAAETSGGVASATWVPGRLDKDWEAIMKYAEDVSKNLLTAVLKGSDDSAH